MDNDSTLISCVDDDGNEITFEILDTLDIDDDKRYVAVVPHYDDPTELLNDSGEFFVLRIADDGEGGFALSTVEDDGTLSKIYSKFEKRLDEKYYGHNSVGGYPS